MGKQRPTVNWRSIGVGLLGVSFVCGLTPYNDLVVANTYLVGNFLPIGLLLFFLILVTVINAPFWRWRPALALSGGELSVALGMTLVSCAVPSSGLLRQLPAELVGFFNQAAQNPSYARMFREMQLPDWLFPTMRQVPLSQRAADPVISHYIQRAPGIANDFISRWNAVPWQAWAKPALAWGVLLIGVYGAVMFLCLLVQRQWAENERLAFPLAGVFLAIVEPPAHGTYFNALFRSRSFWIAFLIVFAVHGVNTLHEYNRLWPPVPLTYNLSNVFAEAPWRYMEGSFKSATVYFTFIGVSFFIPSSVAFSLWFFYLANQVVLMIAGGQQFEITRGMQEDQRLGAVIVFAVTIVWIGRHHWLAILRQMFRRSRPGDPQGVYLSYAVTGWGFVSCLALIVAWLCFAGASLVGAIVITAGMMTLFLVLARVVAETGMAYAQLKVPLQRPWVYLLNAAPSFMSMRTTAESYFFTSFFNIVFINDMRESLPGYVPQALRIADSAAYPEGAPSSGRPLVLCLALALLTGFLIGGAATLYVEYNHASSLDGKAVATINDYGNNWCVQRTLEEADQFRPGAAVKENHNPLVHAGIGAVGVAVLSVLRLRYAAWPLHPIGWLMATSNPVRATWFSILIGWLCKIVVVRLIGAKGFQAGKPVFLGLILGEAGAAAFWLVVNLLRAAGGLDYHATRFLPG